MLFLEGSFKRFIMHKTILSVGIGGSTIVIFGALIIVASLFRDINNLYDEITADLGEFSDTANEAWLKILLKSFLEYILFNISFTQQNLHIFAFY